MLKIRRIGGEWSCAIVSSMTELSHGGTEDKTRLIINN